MTPSRLLLWLLARIGPAARRAAFALSPRLCRVRLGTGVRLNVPLRCEGRGEVVVESGVTLGHRPAPRLGSGETLLAARAPGSRIIVGKGTAFSNNVSVVAVAAVTIGSDCLVGDLVSIMDSDAHEVAPEARHGCAPAGLPVTIGDNVWVGSRSLILKGVSIGPGSVIAAGSVVTRDIPARSLAAGVPARVLRQL